MENQLSALAKIARENEIIVIADIDHENDTISQTLAQQLADMHTQGIKHLYLERDPTEYTFDDLRADPTAFGDLMREAERLGIQVHLYDDNSKKHARDAQFPEEAAFADEHDFYRKDIDAIIKNAPDPARMKQYLDIETAAYKLDPFDVADRNPRMVENISSEMARYPGEKVLIFGGSFHTDKNNDLDEGLRKAGHQVVTVELNPPESNPAIWHSDYPDFTIYTENPEKVTLFKNPQSGLIQNPDGTIPLWKNTESATQSATHSSLLENQNTIDSIKAACKDFQLMQSYANVVANLPVNAEKESYLQAIENNPEFKAALTARFNLKSELTTGGCPQQTVEYIQKQFDGNLKEMIISGEYPNWTQNPAWTPLPEEWNSLKQDISH